MLLRRLSSSPVGLTWAMSERLGHGLLWGILAVQVMFQSLLWLNTSWLSPTAAPPPPPAAAVAAERQGAFVPNSVAVLTKGFEVKYPQLVEEGKPSLASTVIVKHSVAWTQARRTSARPSFSVVVAAYNQAQFLDETLDSVLGQSVASWELILVDDESEDATWEKALDFLEGYGEKYPITIIHKRNGYVNGDWIVVLDSDDLFENRYFEQILKLKEKQPQIQIVPGCMHNFDATENDYCFPQGFSILGVAHWNKFHASVAVDAALARQVGGYDPSLPWGLEDWNFWLHTAKFNPKVGFIPAITFFYRQHVGTSMRKEMFKAFLEESKAMVRSNHPNLYEPAQIFYDHETIAKMKPESLERIEQKIKKFPQLDMPYLWRALARENSSVDGAIADYKQAIHLSRSTNWQAHYRLACLFRKTGDFPSALLHIDSTLQHCYHDRVLQEKRAIESALTQRGLYHTIPNPFKVNPAYWESSSTMADTEKASLAYKLKDLDRKGVMLEMLGKQNALALAVMTGLQNKACDGPSANQRVSPNLVHDSGFEVHNQASPWAEYMGGFSLRRTPAVLFDNGQGPLGASNDPDDKSFSQGRPFSVKSLTLESMSKNESKGAVQVITVLQDSPVPILVQGWSMAESVSGSENADYSIYVDINFADGIEMYKYCLEKRENEKSNEIYFWIVRLLQLAGTNEWGWALPFATGSHRWQRRRGLIVSSKPIHSLVLYCILRNKSGTAYFDDMIVAPLDQVSCYCPPNHIYDPDGKEDCHPCPSDRVCVLGHTFGSIPP